MPKSKKSIPHSKNGDKPRYVYGLVDPRDSRIRYVGCSYDPKARTKHHFYAAVQRVVWRLHHHPDKSLSPAWEWLFHLYQNGEGPLVVVLEKCTPDNWREKENDWILILDALGADLTNVRTIAGYDNLKTLESRKDNYKVYQWVD